MEGSKTLFGTFWAWWYKEASSRFLSYLKTLFSYLTDFFSVMICLNTLFYPWKRDQISYEGLGLKEKFEAFTMNLASRMIGAIVKLFTLAAFTVSISALVIFSGLILAIWYLYPLILLVLLIASIVNA